MSIAFDDTGKGLPIVLGHSFLCSGKMWCDQVPALSRNHRVINADFRGHGDSAHALHPFSLYDAVNDVLAVLDQLGIEKAVWCGLSIGGMVAMRAALTCPKRVKALILLDSDAGAEASLRMLKYRAMGACASMFGVAPLITSITRLMFGETTLRNNTMLVNTWRDEFSTVHVPSILSGLNALTRRDSLLERLPDISVPTLVMVGEEDKSLPPPLSARIHEAIENSQFVRIAGAGHLSALEQPDAVNESILKFLAEL